MQARKLLLFVMAITIVVAFTPAKFKTAYKFSIPSIEGNVIQLKKYKGKKILVVNTASQCQYSYQYKELQNLYSMYSDKVIVIGVPSNDFNQEQASNEAINEFCKTNYAITFPLSSKLHVNGDEADPLFKWLCNKDENGKLDATIKWNFNKFLIDEKGKLIAHFPSTVKPLSEEITQHFK